MDLDNMEDLVDVTSLHLFRPEALLWSTPCLQQKCLNVRQKLGTKNVLSHSHHTLTLTLSHSHTLTLTLSHSVWKLFIYILVSIQHNLEDH